LSASGNIPQPVSASTAPRHNHAEEVRKLGEFLATGPLYTHYGFPKEIAESIQKFPETIQLFCAGTCQKEQTFECTYRHAGRGTLMDRGWGEHVAYRCRNCQKTNQKYWYVWEVNSFWKVGQIPELQEWIELKLEAALGESKPLYRKALRSRSFGFGIGSVSYLRRIIEDTTDTLMDLLRAEKWAEWPLKTENNSKKHKKPINIRRRLIMPLARSSQRTYSLTAEIVSLLFMT
jgi:hypothetical protein